MSTLSFKEAAIKILQESKHPLRADEIYHIAEERHLIKTSGKTPEETMGALIYTDIKKHGAESPFVRVGKGIFSAATKHNEHKSPEQMILEYNEAQRKVLKACLLKIDPFAFERLIGELLEKLGYENVCVTKRSGDGGIDVTATLTVYGVTNVKTAVQVKRYSANVGDKVVRELRGAVVVDQRGLIITTADFTKAAKEEASAENKMPISLVNGEKLLELLVKYGIGVKTQKVELISLNEEYFKELEVLDEGVVSAKKKTIWPLPGGIDHYYDSLLTVLSALKKEPMTKDSFVKWFKKQFDSVSSDKTVTSYISNIFSNLGLVQRMDKVYKLTPVAESLLNAPSKEAVFDILKNRIFGIEETLSLIESSDSPVSESDVRTYLVENFDVDWETNTQASFRLLWLWNLDKIKRNEDGKYVKR